MTTHFADLPAARRASSVNLGCGVWLLLTPLIFGYYDLPPAFWNDTAVGVLTVIFAGARRVSPNWNEEASWVVAGMGAWEMLAPFLLNYGAYANEVAPNSPVAVATVTLFDVNAAIFNAALVGLVMMVMGSWSAMATRAYKTRRTRA